MITFEATAICDRCGFAAASEPSVDSNLAQAQALGGWGHAQGDDLCPRCTADALGELWDKCNQHDWLFMMSDDRRSYNGGRESQADLELEAATIPGGLDLVRAFALHVFSGPNWGSDEQPKPERPTKSPP